MPHHRTVAAFALLGLAVLVSGCTVFGLGDDVTSSSGVGNIDLSPAGPLPDEPPYRPVDQVYFSLDGTVVDDDTFADVSLCLYDRNEAVIASEDLGAFTTPSTVANVTVETDQIPHYIYVHHPRFTGIDGFDNRVLIYRPERHAYGHRTSDHLPFDTRQMTETGCEPLAIPGES